MKLNDVTTEQIEELLLDMQSQGKAHSTIIGAYSICSICNVMFQRAYRKDLIDKNPMDKVDRPEEEKAKREKTISAFTADQAKHILDCTEKEPLLWRTLIRLMIDTGVRRGEACGLRWSSLDFDTCKAVIDGSLDYTHGYGVYRAETKSGKTREVYFSEQSKVLLKALRKAQNNSGVIPQYVFCLPGTANPVHPQAVYTYFRRFESRYGIDHFHPHKTRHTFGSIAATNGMDLVSIKEVMGHAYIKTTQKYCHGNDESRRRVAETIFSALKQA